MKSLIFRSFIFFALTTAIIPQSGSVGIDDAYSASLGKTYTIMSRGIYALGHNPANLALSDDKHWELVLPPSIGLRAGTDFLTINEINYFFGGVQDSTGNTVGRFLNNNDKDRMRNLFKNGGNFIFDFSSLDFGFSIKPNDKIGAFGFSVQDVFSTKFTFPSGIVDLILTGNPIDKEYTFNDFRFTSWYLRTYTFAYAHDISFIFPKVFQSLSIGIAVKSVSGYGYANLEKNTFQFHTYHDSLTAYTDINFRTAVSPDFGVNYDFDSLGVKKNSKVSIFPQAAGNGMGFDFGLSAVVNDRLSVGFAITDIGSIAWKEGTAEHTSNQRVSIDDVSDSTKRQTVIDSIKFKGNFIDGFSTDLPTTIRFGVAYIVIPEILKLSTDLNVGLSFSVLNI